MPMGAPMTQLPLQPRTGVQVSLRPLGGESPNLFIITGMLVACLAAWHETGYSYGHVIHCGVSLTRTSGTALSVCAVFQIRSHAILAFIKKKITISGAGQNKDTSQFNMRGKGRS